MAQIILLAFENLFPGNQFITVQFSLTYSSHLGITSPHYDVGQWRICMHGQDLKT